MRRCLRTCLALALTSFGAAAADWSRPGLNTNQPVWGLRGGLLWAIHPGGFRLGEPQGLIRLGYPVLSEGRYDLINFIAIEPVVKGRRGFSELEPSQVDQRPGKGIWAGSAGVLRAPVTNLWPGRLTALPGAVEQLEVTLRVEKFDNGAHVRLLARQRSDRPDELELSVRAEPDCAPLDSCILTATMGNMARTRLLWLKDEAVSSLKLYPDYKDTGFAPPTIFPLARLHLTAAGDVLVAVTCDEENPAVVHPFSNSRLWYYGGRKVTQYWRRSAGTFRDDLHAAVNGRYTYWLSRRPIPGGVAFENFELRERFQEGQTFTFGITSRTPGELGFETSRRESSSPRPGP
jgi:hypothetical protein